MLLEFRVSNYRSIKNEQVFSLLSFNNNEPLNIENVHETGNVQIPNVLRSAVIYGPNASGKSNLIQAMNIMQALIRDSATLLQAGQALNIQPFAFDSITSQELTTFEVTILIDNIRYQYGFSLTSQRIYGEWLLVYKSAKSQEWYSRDWDDIEKKETYTFNKTYFTGKKDIWRQNTRDNALFLSTAILLNNEQLKPLWNFLVNKWAIIPSNTSLPIFKTVEYFEHPTTRPLVMDFMNSADFGIADIEVQREKVKATNFQIDAATGQARISDQFETENLAPVFTHKGQNGGAILKFHDESIGTQKHFALAGIVLDVLQNGSVLVIDEMENSLHPLLVRHIIKIFNSSSQNPKGAQLIFTTHDTSLMDRTLFRRDQIWFTEKNTELSTYLFSLIDFQGVRNNEVFEKRYFEGRYGAIPILRDFSSPMSGLNE